MKRWLKELIASFAFSPGEINVIACSDDYLLDVNKKYLNHDYYTDIVTFDYSDGKKISGDLFISIHRVTENAIRFSDDFNHELLRVVAHGVLHLVGYKDKTKSDIVKMRNAEEEAISRFKLLIINS
ncbi:MAG: rRNA maturation RNase YbeY [Bacteroidia bacterium]